MVNGNTVTAPVNVKEVYDLIGAGTYNGFYDVGYLCSNDHKKINPYSKFKPVINTKLIELTDADFKASNWGYHIPEAVNLATLVGYYATPPTSWTPTDNRCTVIAQGWWYEPPKGGSSSPYRLSDFCGYNAGSEGPVFRLIPNTYIINTDTSEFLLTMGYFMGLSFEDFSTLANLHFGIYVVKDGESNGKYTCILDSSYTDPTIKLNNSAISKMFPSAGSYKIYVFATTNETQNYDSTLGGYLANPSAVYAHPLPIPPLSITKSAPVSTETFAFNIADMYVLKKGGSIYYLNLKITAKNKATGSATFFGSSLEMTLHYYNSSGADKTDAPTTIVNTNTVIAAGETKTVYDGSYTTSMHHYVSAPFYVEVVLTYPNNSGKRTEVAYKSIYYDDQDI